MITVRIAIEHLFSKLKINCRSLDQLYLIYKIHFLKSA